MGRASVCGERCRRSLVISLAAGLLALVSCAGQATQRTGQQSAAVTLQDPSRGAATVAMEVKWLPPDAASWQVLEPDGTIPSGVRFTVRVELPSPMYLYVAHRSADGSLSWLSPKGGAPESPASANEVTQIPEGDGQWFNLDNKTGRETLFVIAAAQAQSRTELTRQLRAEPPAGNVTRRDPPPLVTQDKRGLQGMHVVRVGVSAQGSALLRLDYQHN